MKAPSRRQFLELAARGRVAPVWRRVLADLQSPVAAFLRLEPRADAFLLESVERGERWGRFSIVGGDSFARVTARGGRIEVTGDVPLGPEEGEPPLAFVRRLVEALPAAPVEGLPPFRGGAVGYIGYDCVRELERLPGPPPDDLGLPDLALLLTRTFVVFDHLEQSAWVICNSLVDDDPAGAYDRAMDACDEMVDALTAPQRAPAVELDVPKEVAAHTTVTDDEYVGWVRAAQDHIVRGDIFQVVPSRRFEMDLPGSAFAAYRALRTINPSPYMYFFRAAGAGGVPAVELAGSSPEPLVRVQGRRVVARPIAGTRRRGVDDAEDRALEEELRSDEKERAEHVMLVDLARNDVGRVARYGSVVVDELMVVERYSHVMHLVSNVSGELAPGRGSFDALTACFPAGTVSGAPKVRAMEIIDGLERTKRGPYAGVVGYLDFAGNLDVAITIRTIVATGGRAYVQAGAGVVADSVPEAEAQETRAKAEALLRACAAAGGLDAY